MDLTHQRKLEGLANSMGHAIDRKRKGLTLHADELPGLKAALDAAILPGIEGSLGEGDMDDFDRQRYGNFSPG